MRMRGLAPFLLGGTGGLRRKEWARHWAAMGSVPLALLIAALTAGSAEAALRTEPVEYRHGETVLEGSLAYDDATQAKRPGILIVHEWKGLNDYTKRRAAQLAQLGYVAFAADIYGKGVRAQDHGEAARLAGIYRSDRSLMRGRAQAGLEVLRRHPLTDPEQLAAIGYCFGGTPALELARSGADVDGVVSFHGGLATPRPEDARHVQGRVLVLHGGGDPFISPEEVAAFRQEMEQAGVRYQLIVYPGAVHSFTVSEAGNDPASGSAYHPHADQQSWHAMLEFFKEIFGRDGGGDRLALGPSLL